MNHTIGNTNTQYGTLGIAAGFCILLCLIFSGVRAQNPSASFTSSVFSGCAPLSVDFTNLSVQANSYYWDFGNGNVSTLTNPTTVYTASGFYTVTLVATNTLTGAADTLVATNYIRVVADPVADFVASPTTACLGNHSISFTNQSTGATNYIWDFGDGSFSTQANPSHVYQNTGVYTVKLIARNGFGCNDIRIRTNYITIVPNPPASFTVNQQSSCDVNQIFNFTCTTPGVVIWQWSFGDGTTSAVQNPSHIYGTQGSFDVTLIVTNANGCSDTLVNPAYINIGNSLVPSFTMNSNTGCAPFNASFLCTVPNATSWLWDFGDGTTSSVQNPSHNYTLPGSYDITLTVTTVSGCNGTVVLPGYVVVDALPNPFFTVVNPLGCAPLPVTFTNTSTGSASYNWDFGNGFTSTDTNPVYTYPDTGIYNVTLTAFSPNGCSSTFTIPAAVTVENLTVNFTASNRVGCAPLTVNFTGTSSPAAVTWDWDFGDGNTGSGQNPTHTYTAIGSYTVTLVATSASGCTDTLRRVNYIRLYDDSTAYTVPDTIIVCLPPGSVAFTDPTSGSNSWLWDFGDGNTGTVRNPTHTYTVPGVYTVTLNTGMAGGCTQVFNPYAFVNVIPFLPSPIVSVIASPCAPFTVSFDNATPNVASYLWDFGDGTTSTLQNPVHVYAQAGTYTVSLQLTSIDGCSVSLSTTITFGYINPITVSDDDACFGDTTVFSLNPSAAFVSVSWDFGDGNSSSLHQLSHVYSAPGSYQVSVTVTDTSGCTYTFNYPNPVLISDPQPGFTISQNAAGCIPFTVVFNNTSTGATSYLWDFGDGGTSSSSNPPYTYITPGIYDITLTATANGCSRSLTADDFISVFGATAGFTFTPDSGCIPITATFSDLSVNAVSWLWDFGDGNTSVLQNPVHVYNAAPAGPVSLIITDTNGCSDSISMPNVVVVVPDITVSDTAACRPASIQFSTSVSAASYLWDFGDGSTSVLQNPTHVYTQSGLFTVSLTCVLSSGCTTSNVQPGLVTVLAPVAGFISPTLAVCAPSLVNFTNQSAGAVSYLWDFGDGSTSVNPDPSHIYNNPGTYTVTLVATSADGCTDTLLRPDYIVVPGTQTLFSVSDSSICQGSLIQFTDQSVNATDWFWNFGDGFTSTAQNPAHIYADTGLYSVTLITNDSVGCSSFYTLPVPVSVHPMPVANAIAGPMTGCTPVTCNFTNLSTGNGTCSWDFGNGATSTATDPTYTYNIPGTYYPQLITTTPFGCVDTFQFITGITVGENPVASFSTSASSGCAPLSVYFNNTSQNTSGATYFWDFGNSSSTSTLQNPGMYYVVPGVYQVSMMVTNAGGCSDSVSQTITVLASPVAQFTVSDTSGCGPFTTTFTDQSTGASSWYWDFGDGSNSSLANPAHTYNMPGTYQVTLVVANVSGCTDTLMQAGLVDVSLSPVANFTRSPNSGCIPLDVVFTSTSSQLSAPTYNWDFGNGSTGSNPADTVTYTSSGVFPVSLVVTNSNGCSDTVIKNIRADQTPVANAIADQVSGCAPVTVQFSDQSAFATSLYWDFGDGNTSTASNPSHTYTTPGAFQPFLVASGPGGCRDTFYFPFPVTVNLTPVANFTRSPNSGCLPLDVIFTSTSTQLSAPVYNWDFGNGQTGSNPADTVLYTTSGLFPVTLVVTNSNGCSDTVIKNIRADQTPVASGTVDLVSGCAPFSVQFTSNSTHATGLLWHFGDGNTSSAGNPVHTYASPGVYHPFLVATGTGGCRDTFYLPVPITGIQSPVASFGVSGTATCAPAQFIFDDQSSQLSNPAYQWNLGNGQVGTGTSVTGLYTSGGNYTIMLVVTNDGVCSDTAISTLQVFDSPIASASTADTAGCAPYSVQFTDNSVNGISWNWDFGDGNTSTQQTPAHVYTAPGNYQVTLIVTGNGGCADTLILPQTISVGQTPVAGISIPSVTGCTPFTVQFGNSSTGLSGPTFTWEYGNGVTSGQTAPTYTYAMPGVFQVTLTVVNQGGCSSSDTVTLTAEQSPVALASPYPSSGCIPFEVSFNSLSQHADSVVWYTGDGGQFGGPSALYNYLQSGTWQPYLVAMNASGCTDTLFTAPVIVSPSPLAGFTVNQTSGCPGSSFQFTTSPAPAPGIQYQWTIGGTNYSGPNPLVVPSSTGFMDVQLIVTNQAGCSDTMFQPQYIQVFDSLPPPASPIMSVSVVDNGSVRITWQNSASLDLSAYILYRYNTASAQYQEIFRDTTPANASMVVTSDYTDTGLNTLSNSYTYKLSTIDLCAQALPLSSLTAHTTINVEAVPVAGSIRVDWSPYSGCAVGTYELRREEMATGNNVLLATLPPNVLTYTDTGFVCPELYSYRITATSLCGTLYQSLSDTSSAQPANNLAGQRSDIVRSTVVNDQDVLTEWLPPAIMPQRVIEYVLMRSDDGVNYTEVARIPAGTHSYLDYNVLVHQQEYHYRVDVINDCSMSAAAGAKGTSIFLQSKYQDDKSRLWWTPYAGWNQGVDHYIIEQLDNFGQWSPVKTVDGNSLEVIIDE